MCLNTSLPNLCMSEKLKKKKKKQRYVKKCQAQILRLWDNPFLYLSHIRNQLNVKISNKILYFYYLPNFLNFLCISDPATKEIFFF